MDVPPPDEITRMLRRATDGAADAEAALVPLIYDKLRALAGQLMAAERPGHTLQPTALVHEAYARMVDEVAAGTREQAHYMRCAARAMREILVDHARRRGADKRGAGWRRTTLQGVDGGESLDLDLLALDAALGRLREIDPRQAEIVDLRYFAGMTGQQIADALGLSRRHVVREMRVAQAWLLRAMDA